MAIRRFMLTGTVGEIEALAHIPEAAPRGLAVVAHPLPTMGGTMENKVAVTLARAFAELGCVAVRFNFRGVGKSAGEFTGGDGEEQDMVDVVRHAEEQFGETLPLFLAGFSFGGYVAARVARCFNPRQLVLVAPAVSRFAMPGAPPDTLLIHGEQDEVVPLSAILDWARPQALPVVVLPGAEHFFHGRLMQLRDIVQRYVRGSL